MTLTSRTQRPPGTRPRIDPRHEAQARAAYEAGESQEEIGRRLGISVASVRRRARLGGWQRPAPKPKEPVAPKKGRSKKGQGAGDPAPAESEVAVPPPPETETAAENQDADRLRLLQRLAEGLERRLAGEADDALTGKETTTQILTAVTRAMGQIAEIERTLKQQQEAKAARDSSDDPNAAWAEIERRLARLRQSFAAPGVPQDAEPSQPD